MFRLVPPAGTPIKVFQLLKTVSARFRSKAQGGEFEEKISQFSEVRRVWLINSGRSALALILQALSSLAGPDRDEVIIPAYTCFSVPAAVVRGRLKIRLVDVDPLNMDYRYDRLGATDFTKVLCIVACNLFGIVNDWKQMRKIACEHDTYLVDDAAQSMGAYYEGRTSGALGDVGFYSLDRGKSLSTYSGGVLLSDDRLIADELDKLVADLPNASLPTEASVTVKLLLYALLLRPAVYRLPDSLPFLGLGKTDFEPDFPISRLSKLQSGCGNVVFDSLGQLTKTRADRAGRMAHQLTASEKYAIPGFDPRNMPSYPRLPVLASDSATRDACLVELRRRGIVASRMYPSTIRSIPGIESHLASGDRNFPGAEELVRRLFTLPTHPYVSNKDTQKIVACLTSL
jgi:dTDP-4-amino-4,6-dideoxygalactose transaminase